MIYWRFTPLIIVVGTIVVYGSNPFQCSSTV